ncbi:NTP transferase domain-containing protein [Arachidicoccus terrestris]|uniref:NTP transferase domain-containing protein n=1 Tax=Arachidicoccus terrestris TaxID=2875539 RepID=UPI001CC3B6FE|nr:NTP transferase domain-containing protein [Arachidicoccus terrestris]UAY56698.1 NTP transferase domain-containing protein [Arachidicoccus terrestris]
MTLKEDRQLPLNGLVLAGGKSTRMGQAKDQIKWYDKEQRYHAADLLSGFCKDVFISCRPDQTAGIDRKYKRLPDRFLNKGPLGGILTALSSDKAFAWLVVACDLPLLNEATLQLLLNNRDRSKTATAFLSPYDGLPEPLITIWEPDSYSVLLESLDRGISCPRKVLINSDIKSVIPVEPDALMNVNTPEEAARAKEFLNTP